MAVFESTEFTSSRLDGVTSFLDHARLRVLSFVLLWGKRRTIRQALLRYSSHELEELGIERSDIPSIADALARGQSTRCEMVNLEQGRVLRKG